ncbi:MAG: glycerophosphodiester phosphodiesterase [Chitinophagaceae bacterium]|nr:glycerophosphodiester phosphodiesterase [Chitinophagaceae bacterium]
MKRIIFSACLLFCLSCSVNKQTAKPISFAGNPVVAHRGAFKLNKLPENSIAALKEAIRLKCTGSEFDVRMTADDSLIINHDPHFNKLEIEKVSYAELMAFKLSNGEPLPTLQQYLVAGMQSNTATRLVLEIKPSGISKERGKRIAEKVVQLVKQLKADAMIVYISFDYDILLRIRELDEKAILQYLEGNKAPAQVKADKIDGIDYHFSFFQKNPTWIAEAKQHKLALNAWTVNDSTTMSWLLKEGFDYITTNEPELLFRLLKK